MFVKGILVFYTYGEWFILYLPLIPQFSTHGHKLTARHYMLLHPLEGSITFITQDPCHAPLRPKAEGVAAGVAGDKCDTTRQGVLSPL